MCNDDGEREDESVSEGMCEKCEWRCTEELCVSGV